MRINIHQVKRIKERPYLLLKSLVSSLQVLNYALHPLPISQHIRTSLLSLFGLALRKRLSPARLKHSNLRLFKLAEILLTPTLV
jgi:hypothetical protein